MDETASTNPCAKLSPPELVALLGATNSVDAWEEFVRRFHSFLCGVAVAACRRFGIDPAEMVEDLVQETYVRLCANDNEVLRRFEPTGSVHAYLRVIAVNLAVDTIRARYRTKRGGGVRGPAIEEADWAASDGGASAAATEREALVKQIDDVFRSRLTGPTAARDRSIFWLYYRSGMRASAIARVPGIGLGVSGVESVIYRLTAFLREIVAQPKGNQEQKSLSKGRR